MQLEAGKKYVDRRGRVYGPMVEIGCGGPFGEDRDDYGWYPSGQRSPGKSVQGDLVAEYVESPKPAEPEYRLLTEGELIQEGDEYEYCGKWKPIPSGVGKPWTARIYVPHRRLVKPDESKAMESPDDWVIQDRVLARNGIDRGWFAPCVTEAPSHPWLFRSGVNAEGRKHGDKMTWGDTLNVYCRRKDLPPLPPKTRKVVLKEWICWDESHTDFIAVEWSTLDPSGDEHQFEAFDHAVETGNTREVEIPVT